MKRRAHVCWLVANVGLQGLVIEADDEVPTIAIAEGKGAANNFGKSLQLVGADPALDFERQAYREPSKKLVDAGPVCVHPRSRRHRSLGPGIQHVAQCWNLNREMEHQRVDSAPSTWRKGEW